MGDLVTIETYTDSTEATLAKNDLIESGIKAVLVGAEANALWNVPTEMAMIKLQVAAEDAVRAAEIIKNPARFLSSEEDLSAESGDMSEKDDDDSEPEEE